MWSTISPKLAKVCTCASCSQVIAGGFSPGGRLICAQLAMCPPGAAGSSPAATAVAGRPAARTAQATTVGKRSRRRLISSPFAHSPLLGCRSSLLLVRQPEELLHAVQRLVQIPRSESRQDLPRALPLLPARRLEEVVQVMARVGCVPSLQNREGESQVDFLEGKIGSRPAGEHLLDRV